MKIGYRKPNLKSSLKARTTGKIKRKMKSAVNPLYGKKGMGLINNPKKAVYNKIYSKTTIDPLKSFKKAGNQNYMLNQEPVFNSYKVISYSCNKWIYIALAFFLGGFGAQYFYSGEKKKGVISLLFCWTGIPIIIGLFVAFTTLFKPTDSNGNITITKKQKTSAVQAIQDANNMRALLEEVSQLEPILTTTIDPSEFVNVRQKIAENLIEVTNFSKLHKNNPNFNSQSMAHALQTMVEDLEQEDKNFITRYYTENPNQEGKERLSTYLDCFGSEVIELVEKIYS